jgi:hypothetical protein
MPAFVGSLLCSFIFNPALKRIGDLWQNKEIKILRKTTGKLALVPIAVDAVLLLGGWFLGIPVLSAVYGVDLQDYHLTLMIFLLASGTVAMLDVAGNSVGEVRNSAITANSGDITIASYQGGLSELEVKQGQRRVQLAESSF